MWEKCKGNQLQGMETKLLSYVLILFQYWKEKMRRKEIKKIRGRMEQDKGKERTMLINDKEA